MRREETGRDGDEEVSVVIVFVGSFSYADGFLYLLCIVDSYSIVMNWLPSPCKGNNIKKSA